MDNLQQWTQCDVNWKTFVITNFNLLAYLKIEEFICLQL